MLGASVLLGCLPHQDVLCVAVRGGVPLCRVDDVDGLQGDIAAVDIEVWLEIVLVSLQSWWGLGRRREWGFADHGQSQSRIGSSLVLEIVGMRA